MAGTQKAVVVKKCGGVDALELVTDWPIPQRKDGEVLIKLTSTSVNPVDTYVRSGGGTYGSKILPKCLGGDVAGEVVEADQGSKFKKGDKVFALTYGYYNEIQEGSYCQYVSVSEKDVVVLPAANLPADEAGAVPLVALTAWQALEPCPPGQAEGKRVLVLAASGGVGHIAVQLAKARGIFVVGVAGPDNQAFLKEIGCDETINYKEQDAAQVYKDSQFDLVLDLIGGDTNMQKLVSIIKPGGTYTHVFNRGTDQEMLGKLNEAASKGEGPKVHTVLVKPDGQQLADIASLISQGKVKVQVAAKFPLEKAADAQAKVETWHTRGKVVITID